MFGSGKPVPAIVISEDKDGPIAEEIGEADAEVEGEVREALVDLDGEDGACLACGRCRTCQQ